MKVSKLIFGMLILCIISGCRNKDQNIDSRFKGMWRLDKIESVDEGSGKWVYDSAFSGWNGIILYDGNGHMGVQITPKGYREFDVNKNIDSLNTEGLKELVRFYQSNWVYFANYKITGNTIEHNRISATNPKDWGSVLTRDFEFKNDTLILTAHERMGGKRSRLWWIK